MCSSDLGTSLAPTVSIGASDKYNLNANLGSINICLILAVDADGVTNNPSADGAPTVTQDTTAPTLSSATLNNSVKTLTLTFNEGVSVPTATGYTINGDDGKTHTLTGGTVSGSAGSTGFTITYTDYDTNAINRLRFASTSTVTVAASNVSDGDNNIAGATVSLTTSGITKGGDGCSGDCTPPTLGIDNDGKRLVSNGFTYNGHRVDVERFFTPYPLITANVGKTNTAQFKIYENGGTGNIKHFSFGFGLAKGEVISESKAMIEWDKSFDGKETVTITDPQNALDDIEVNTSVVSCMPDSVDQCLEIEIIHRFRESLDFDIVATDVWDNSRNVWQNYYNHGIHVTGDSLNPPKEYDAIHKGKIFHLTQVDKLTAVDENGEFWTLEYGQWSKNYMKPEPRIDEPVKVMTRNHSQFNQMIQKEIEIATEKLLEICPTCQKSWTD